MSVERERFPSIFHSVPYSVDPEEQEPSVTMSMKLNPPVLHKCKNYAKYKVELEGWETITDLDKKKRGMFIALTLPTDEEDKDNTGIRDKVFEQITKEDLAKEDGLQTLLTFLDKHLGKDELSDSLEKFEDFDGYRREKQPINDFIANFDTKYQRLFKLDMKLPSPILAFTLLKRANVSKQEKQLVLTGMNFAEKDELYDQAKNSLKKFLGDQPTGGACGSSATAPVAIKLEPAFFTENEEALYAAGYVHESKVRGRGFGRGASGRRGQWRGGGSGRDSHGSGGMVRGGTDKDVKFDRRVNPNGQDGRTLLCAACGSYRHLLANCPDSWENMSKANKVNVVEEEAVLFTGFNNNIETKIGLAQLSADARNCAVLDSACSSTVCGQNWIDCYIESLSVEDKEKITISEGVKVFKFGGGEKLRSKGSYKIPAVLAGKEVTVQTDVVESDIPLLLSKKAMKTARVKLDLENDTAEILGKQVALNDTHAGHYCVSIDRGEETKVESVHAVKLHEMSENDRYQAMLKLHRQFAHPPEKKLKALMVDAGVWREEFASDITKIQKQCNICKMYAKTPSRPVVALPMASRFNQKVCVDLKKWKQNRWILHMIDMFSRFSVSVLIDRKRPKDVINKIMSHWVAIYGMMEAILSDNGGEFSSDEMREVGSIINVELCTTAAESPFQNGLCERNHAVVDMMLLKMEEQCPDTGVEVLLCWANMAKNSMQMNHGYSSHQIVFGKNPNLPNIMTDNVPALEGTTSSEMLAKHLNALHAARRAFVASEADERIRRALRHKVRASEQTFHHGDRVYYKRDGQERWLGPGKVVFQDGKIVFVRHGGVFVRVCPNRLIKAGHEYSKEGSGKIEDTDDRNIECDMPDDNCGEEIGVYGREENPADPAVQNIDSVAERCTAISQGDRIKYKVKQEDDWQTATVLGRAGKAIGRNKHWYNIEKDSSGEKISIDFENIAEWDSLDEEVNMVMVPRGRHGEAECIKAKEVELDKLREFNTYEEVTDFGQNRISTTWVLWWKGDEVRARLVARGFEEEQEVRSDSPTISKSMMRVMLAIASSKLWKVKTTDIKSAFLQGRKMERDVYIVPPKEASVEKGKLWKLKRCLYGLHDAARHFYQSIVEAMKSLGCQQSSYDPALFYMQENGKLIGMMACHIDDFLHAGEGSFDAIMCALRSRFLAGKLEEGQFKYVGLHIQQFREEIVIDQSDYVESIECMPIAPERASQKKEAMNSEELTGLRSMVGKINWVVQGTRPDMSFEMIELSTHFRKGSVMDMIRAVKVIRKLKEGACKVSLPALGDISCWKIMVYSDAAHANLCDGVGSVGAHIVMIAGEDDKCCVVSWHAAKIKRVVRSSLAAEALSLQEGIEDAIYIRHNLETLLDMRALSIPVHAVVDNKSLVEAVHSTRLVDDKRLRLDIAAVREALENSHLTSVSWCPGTAQLANCMTKRGAAGFDLLAVMQSGKYQVNARK